MKRRLESVSIEISSLECCLGALLPSSSTNAIRGGESHGPSPMEVDLVSQGKGKYKGKGKQKGKQHSGGWQQAWSSMWGKGSGKSKGGGKSKGKDRSKGKGKAKGKGKGKEKGKLSKRQCRVCGGYGHWGNECSQRQRVNEVISTSTSSPSVQSQIPVTACRSSGATPSVGSTSATSLGPAAGVHMYHIGTPPNEESYRVASDKRSVCSFLTSSDFRAWAVFLTEEAQPEEFYIGDHEGPDHSDGRPLLLMIVFRFPSARVLFQIPEIFPGALRRNSCHEREDGQTEQ